MKTRRTARVVAAGMLGLGLVLAGCGEGGENNDGIIPGEGENGEGENGEGDEGDDAGGEGDEGGEEGED